MDFKTLRRANVQRCGLSFHPINNWSPMEWACAMAGEAGETCNAVKKLKRLEDGLFVENNPNSYKDAIQKIADEIADTIIYADLLAARLNIDLTTAVKDKFNQVSARVKSDIFI